MGENLTFVKVVKIPLFCFSQRSCKHCFKNEWTLIKTFNLPDNLRSGVRQNNSEFSLGNTIISSFSMSIGITSLGINNLITERVGPGRGKGYGWGSTGWGPGGGCRYRGRGKSAALGCCCGKTNQGQKAADKGLKK